MLFSHFLAGLLVIFLNENKKFRHLGSITPYRFIANNNVTEPEFKGCTPTKIWVVIRHGTRNPSAELIEEIKINLTSIRDEILLYSNLSQSHVNALKHWNFSLSKHEASELRQEGEKEMLLLAQRMQKRYPSLFPSVYNNQTFLFKYTASERTNDSAQGFATGLFGHEGAKNVVYDNSKEANFLLRFYKFCKKWIVQVKNNPNSYVEQDLFDRSSVMVSAIKELKEKLNLKTKLTKDHVQLIYSTCGFETAWNEGNSIWCNFLPLELMKILEFSENVKSYYVHGYAHNITYEQACPLFNDMIKHFTSEDPFPTTAMYFTHSGTILKFLAHLGLYKSNQPLNHTDYKNGTYKWNESRLDAFGSNIEFVLYSCDGQHKVAVYHQERIVQLPNCTKLCDLDSLKKIYRKSINCEFDKMCNL